MRKLSVLLVALVVIGLGVAVFLFFYSQKLSRTGETGSFATYKGVNLNYGYDNDSLLGFPSYTGKVVKFGIDESGKAALEMNPGGENFSFDPKTTMIVTANGDKGEELWSIWSEDALKKSILKGTVLTLRLSDSKNTPLRVVIH